MNSTDVAIFATTSASVHRSTTSMSTSLLAAAGQTEALAGAIGRAFAEDEIENGVERAVCHGHYLG